MLGSLFSPKNVAVIGASSKELSIGNRIIKNLVDFGFKGAIYPINPKSDTIRGIKAYNSILEVPETGGIDVVHLVIPAKFCPMAFEDCARMKVRHIIINSGGFSEVGPEGVEIEKKCMDIANKYGMRVMGPNCQGIINTDPDVRAYCNFTFTIPEPGYISLVVLSGGVAELIHQGVSEMGVGTRIYASNGNAVDVSIPEIIEYLGEDAPTRVIVTYVEGLRDAARFMRVARKVSKRKPILAMKAGRTREGAKAAASHTGGLAKEEKVTDLIFAKAGILSFADEGALIRAATAFASQPVPKGNRVGIITNTGGPAVISTDVLAADGLRIPPLGENTRKTLEQALLPEASVRNPVDVLATANGAHFRACLEAFMADDNFDLVYVNFVTPFFVDNENIAREIAAVSRRQEKPIVCNLMTDRRRMRAVEDILKDGGVPCFAFPSDAARAVSALVRYHAIQSRSAGKAVVFEDVDADAARRIVDTARKEGRMQLGAGEVNRLLECYGLPVPAWRIAETPEQAAAAAGDLGYPVVLKADAAGLVHKSDGGGVMLNLQDGKAVREAAADMRARIGIADMRFFVQKFHPPGLELIMGAKAEEPLGHVLMFGIGGIFVEVMKDVSFCLTPLSDAEADEMLSSIKGAPLLDGVRGGRGVDRAALSDTLLRLNQMVIDLPWITEMDMNPVTAYPDGVCVLDARISLSVVTAAGT